MLLAFFNLLPLPPLDGGRIMAGVPPDSIASALARLEPNGMTTLIGALFILPLLGARLGMNLDVVWQFINRLTNIVIDAILRSTGNAWSVPCFACINATIQGYRDGADISGPWSAPNCR